MCLFHLSEKAKANEDKFRKMKEVYAKLREEHVALIRTVSSHMCLWYYGLRFVMYLILFALTVMLYK